MVGEVEGRFYALRRLLARSASEVKLFAPRRRDVALRNASCFLVTRMMNRRGVASDSVACLKYAARKPSRATFPATQAAAARGLLPSLNVGNVRPGLRVPLLSVRALLPLTRYCSGIDRNHDSRILSQVASLITTALQVLFEGAGDARKETGTRAASFNRALQPAECETSGKVARKRLPGRCSQCRIYGSVSHAPVRIVAERQGQADVGLNQRRDGQG